MDEFEIEWEDGAKAVAAKTKAPLVRIIYDGQFCDPPFGVIEINAPVVDREDLCEKVKALIIELMKQ